MGRLLAAAAVVLAAACSRTPSIEISFLGTSQPTAIEISGLPGRDVNALQKAALSRDQWQQILNVTVAGATIPIAGDYAVVDGMLRFTPMYGFDPGRPIEVRFDPSRIPGADPADPWRAQKQEVLAPAAKPLQPATAVSRVYPSGGEVVANMLRFYIEFSGPMGQGSPLEQIRLVDEHGKEVVDPFLPVEAGFWTPDRTRFTLFFDPGRVKRGIKPNRDMGRALIPGKRYALVIDEGWLDGQGRTLKSEYRHEFTVRPPIEHPLDESRWIVEAPAAGTTEPLQVTFPWPLDYGLLNRAFSVRRGDVEVAGAVAIGPRESRWRFTPKDPWTAGDHTLVALTLLEDPAGNRLGRAFEVRQPVPERELVEVPFTVK
jgi:hypothetical protein